MRTGALVLAAGKSSRFGSPKQLLELEGETLVDRACRVALEAGCQPVLRLLGAHTDRILDKPAMAGVETFVHVNWQDGMGNSLAAGLARLLELAPGLDAVFVLLPDQPLVSVGLLETMQSLRSGATVVWCGHPDTRGPPALFDRRHFNELLKLSGDQGAKAVVAKHPAAVVEFAGAAWDIDSPETWDRFLEHWNGQNTV